MTRSGDELAAASAGGAIVVVEDDRVVAETLRLYLEHAGFRVRLAADGRDGLEVALREPTALVLLDVMLPGLDGREVCRRLRAASSVPIVMLTARTAEDDVVAALEAGADDYIGKPFRPAEVVARVRALLRRRPLAAGGGPGPAALRIGEIEIDSWSHRVRLGGCEVTLTPTEHRLLATLAGQPGRAFSRDELARALAPQREAQDRTIDSHVNHLRRKLEAAGGARTILTVPGVGYRLRRDDEHA